MDDGQIGMSLARHIYETQRQHPAATGELSGILTQITLAAKIVNREVNKAGLADILGLTGERNVQGEEVRKLDAFANDVFISTLEHSGHFCIMASEEMDGTIAIPDEYPAGGYSIAFDPLDGSSNIDVNVSIGTIFAIHRKVSNDPRGAAEDLLQPGRDLVAAGYVLYGSSTMLVLSVGSGVQGFTMDPSVGAFFKSHPQIAIPARGKIYSVNEGNHPYWSEGVRKYVAYVKERDAATQRPYSSRYIGSMVADIHRTLLKGGIFMYPADSKDPKKPHGKLRLLYECAPMGFLVEQAGGRASTGRGPVLDIEPTDLHQRVPFFAGSPENVRELEAFVARYDGA
ncbi:MAG: class 1 fructose-bisphosphatase [Planctomycetota bacterium]|jgi:fructose-1,6-bisphosphatase I